MANRSQYYQSKLLLVIIGVGLGLLARYTLGVPSSEDRLERKFKEPIPAEMLDREPPIPDIPLSRPGDTDPQGLVPPIQMPNSLPTMITGNEGEQQSFERVNFVPYAFADTPRDMTHDERAIFHPHGQQICDSGCSASRHPTETLSRDHFVQLISELAIEPMDSTNNALEELVYFGPQTKAMIEAGGFTIDRDRLEFLWRELAYTHAIVEIRVVDERGVIRSWLPATRVPLDRRHVFEMQTQDLQPLVTSGTVKRVGLDHLWTRL